MNTQTAPERIELPNGSYWEHWPYVESSGSIKSRDGKLLIPHVTCYEARAFAAAIHLAHTGNAELNEIIGCMDYYVNQLHKIAFSKTPVRDLCEAKAGYEGAKQQLVIRPSSNAQPQPSAEAEVKLPAHKAAIADIQLSEHVLKLLKHYDISVPEDKLPDFEMQLCYDMGKFRGDFAGHTHKAHQAGKLEGCAALRVAFQKYYDATKDLEGAYAILGEDYQNAVKEAGAALAQAAVEPNGGR